MSLGIYAHIPFCVRRCDYCDFFVMVGYDRAGEFFEWLRRDIAVSAMALGGRFDRVDTVYFGGGTPSYVDPEDIAGVMTELRERFTLERSAEVTLEANPESVTVERARAWRSLGISRLSLGVQSLNDEVLPRRGRLYDSAGACAAARVARAAGFGSLSLDLIAGLPGETVESFAAGIDRVIGLSPDHVSVYLLETDDALKDTPLTKAVLEGREALPEEECTVMMYANAVDRLGSAGYGRYEISNFARPGHASRHNLKYWSSGSYLGVGPSAHSHVEDRRFGRPADLGRWIEQVRDGLIADGAADYTLGDPVSRAREALVLGLRLIHGVELAEFSRRWAFDPAVALAREIDELSFEGLLERRDGRLALTPRGILLSNEVFARLT